MKFFSIFHLGCFNASCGEIDLIDLAYNLRKALQAVRYIFLMSLFCGFKSFKLKNVRVNRNNFSFVFLAFIFINSQPHIIDYLFAIKIL